MKRNHGPFLVWTTREMVANAGLSGQKHRVHLDPECGYLHRGDGSSDPLPLVWSFVIATYGSVQTCEYCLNRIKREREARE